MDHKPKFLMEDNNTTSNKKCTVETYEAAIESLRSEKYNDESIGLVARDIFGNSTISLDTKAELVNSRLSGFLKVAKKYSTPKSSEFQEAYLKLGLTMLAEADEEIPAGLKKSFLSLYLPVLAKRIPILNKSSEFRTILKSYKDQSANTRQNKYESSADIKTLVRQYKQAGTDFVVHSTYLMHKMVNGKEKQEDMSALLKDISSSKDNSYLQGIKDIKQKIHVDAAACALALAKKNDGARGKSPYTADTTASALRLSDKYKTAYPKYYERASKLFEAAYDEGMKSAKEQLNSGKTLQDPVTGEDVNSKLIAPVMNVGRKINDFFRKQPWNTATIYPKLLFLTFNILTSKQAKAVYKGTFKLISTAVSKLFAGKDKDDGVLDTKNLLDTSLDTLKNEFQSYIDSYAKEQESEDEENEGK